jgi:hypothetical protein
MKEKPEEICHRSVQGLSINVKITLIELVLVVLLSKNMVHTIWGSRNFASYVSGHFVKIPKKTNNLRSQRSLPAFDTSQGMGSWEDRRMLE